MACASVFVDAANVRNTPDIARVLRKVKRKKMKNCEGSYRCMYWLDYLIFEGEIVFDLQDRPKSKR
jgi:hypothetical protein